MRNRKLFLSLFLLVALTLLGVGYASLTNNLSATGTVGSKADHNNLDVRFVHSHSEPAISVTPQGVSVRDYVYESKSVSFTVDGFTTENEEAIIYLKVANNSAKLPEYNAKLGAFTISMTHGENEPANGSQSGNVYKGTHYSITASYVDGTKPEDKLVQATGTEPIGTVTSDVEATVTATDNQYVYVKISIKVIKPILSDLDNHVFTVAFSAETTEITESN